MMSFVSPMSNEQRSAYSRRPRTSFVEDLSPQGPIVALDGALEAARRSVGTLCRAIALGLPIAGRAADALKEALAFAVRVGTRLPASDESARQLAEIREVAERALSCAPIGRTENGDRNLSQSVAPHATLPPATAACVALPEISHFRMRLRSLRRSLDQLGIVVQASPEETLAPIAKVLAAETNALPRAVGAASLDVQSVVDLLDTSSGAACKCAHFCAAKQRLRQVGLNHHLDAARFLRAEGETSDAVTRAMLANVAMMITFAFKAAGIVTAPGERDLEERAVSRQLADPEG